MADPRMEKLAKVVVFYSATVQKGDWVVIRGDYFAAAPFFQELYRQVIRAGGNPTVQVYAHEFDEIMYKHASEEQLRWIPPPLHQMIDTMDVDIAIKASSNSRMLANVDNEKEAAQQDAFRDLVMKWRKRSDEGSMRWTFTQYPCQAHAQDAGMSLSEYEDFVYQATFADQEDPVKEWQKLYKRQEQWSDWLQGKKNVVMQSPHCDISFSIDGRKFVNADGHCNLPDGEIFTGPVEDSMEGWVECGFPAVRYGREVDGVRLEFKKGKVVKATAEKNEDYLISQLDIDEGARFVGEVGIGTNYGITKFTKNMLFDEKIGGTFHIALGNSIVETGGKNESAIHWDMLCDIRENSRITVDGELFYEDGEFKV